MTASRFRDASPAEVNRLTRSLVAAGVVGSGDELAAMHAADPWRVQLNGRGDVAVLGRWRDHLPYLAIMALWCPASRATAALVHIRAFAGTRGFVDVVSPPTPVEDAPLFEAAGMRARTVVATYQLDRPSASTPVAVPEGLTLRQATPDDVLALLGVDARCFEPFWRYDARHLAGFFASSRLALVERDDEVLGYTLCTVSRGEGLLGRLCVVPEWRRRGVGSSLVNDVVRYVGEQGGVHVMLSTQIENAPSQALYRQANFHDTGRRYAFLWFGGNEG